MQAKCKSPTRGFFYHGRPPNGRDLKGHVKGDLWFNFISTQVYILKCRKGCKKWCTCERFGK